MRLIATLFVVVGHSAYLVIKTKYGGVEYHIPVNVSEVYNSYPMFLVRFAASWVYGFHMPLFFALSGAVLALKPISRLDVLASKKARRLLIPYFLYGWLFMFPVKYIGGFYTKENLFKAMGAYLFGVDSGHLWFLLSLFWCMLFFATLNHGIDVKFRKCKNAIYKEYSLLVICAVISYMGNWMSVDIFGLRASCRYLFWFSLGYVFQNCRVRHESWKTYKVLLLFLMAFFIEIMNIKYAILPSVALKLLGCVFTYSLAELCARWFYRFTETKVWEVITRNLFYIYIFHDPLEYVVIKTAMGHHWLESAVGCWMYIFSRIAGVIIVSILMGELVKRCKNTFYKSTWCSMIKGLQSQ